MNAKRTFIKIGAMRLHKYGYEYYDAPHFKGNKSFFLRKDLGNNVYAFIEFHQYMFVNVILNGEPMPRRFDLSFWKNIGGEPRHGYKKNEENLENWLYLSLPELLWTVLNLKIYEGPNHVWSFHNEEELIAELEDAMDKTLQYGIPWLENPNSRNPYPYEPPNP